MVYGFCSERCKDMFDVGKSPQAMRDSSPKKGYLILGAVFVAILVFTWVRRLAAGDWSAHESMSDFMGAFFVVFAAFKLLDLSGFADAFQTYDLLAAKLRGYALAYPFLQLILGAGYLTRSAPVFLSAATLGMMSLSAAGVARALLKRQKIRCACLGTKIALPMTTISLIEDALMVMMAAAMLF